MNMLRFLRQFPSACALFFLLTAGSVPAAPSNEEQTDVVLDPAEGKISQDTSFSVSFPGPMVKPALISAGNAPSPIALTPKLEGTFLWKSVTDGEFTITGSIAPGTHYKVSTAPGLKNAAGASVPAQKWEFDSDPFEVTAEETDRQELSNRPHFQLNANYPVSLVDAAEAVYFQDRDSHQRLPAEVLIDPDQSVVSESSFTVVPRKPLPAGRTYDVVVNGLRDAHTHTRLAYMHVFAAGMTSPIKTEWIAAFNDPLEKPIIRAKFSESIDPDSLVPGVITLTPEVADLKCHVDGDEVRIEGKFDIKQRYYIGVSKDLKGVRGYGLAEPSKWHATFRPKESEIMFPGDEIFQRSASGFKFSFLQINTGPVTWKLSKAPLDQLPEIIERVKQYKAGEKPLSLETTTEGHFDANNGVEEVLRDIDWHPPQPLNGAYLLEVAATDSDGDKIGNRTLICFSEYMVTEKRTEEQTVVRVARMSDGQGVAKMLVHAATSANLELAKAVTDANGLAVFKNDDIFLGSKPSADLFIVDTPNGPALQYVNGPSLLSAEYHRQENPDVLRSLIVLDRNLYRPGQEVKIHGFARIEKKGSLALPPAGDAKWQIKTESGDPVTDGTAKLDAHGGWDAEWQIPGTLSTGIYRITCKIADLEGTTEDFHVEEYRVPLFSVAVEAVEEPGPAALAKVSSVYFHGAPNARAKVHWKAAWTVATVAESADDNFVRTDEYSENHTSSDDEKDAEGDAVLDENGTATLRCEAPFADGKKRGRCSVAWTVDVTSAEAQTLTGGAEGTVQFANAWAGIRAEAKSGVERTVQITSKAIDLDDKFVDGAPVKLELFHVSTKTVKEKIAPFVVRYRNSSQFEKVGSKDAATPAAADFPVPDTGEYVAVVTGPGGVVCSTTVTVSGEEQAEMPVENDTGLTLALPEPVRPYKPGEVAPISVRAPFGGVAWVTVETGEILDTLFVNLPGNAGRIDLPVKKEYAPNATVAVYLVQPGGKATLPRERIGSLELSVARPDRDLVVTPKLTSESVKPGAPVKGEFLVTSADRPVAGANFLVFAVDDAVLELGGWEMPDLASTFYPLRNHGVSTLAALTRFVDKIDRRSLHEKGYVVGDGGEQAGNLPMVRKEFKTLAFWQSDLTTDASGKVIFNFPAPDNLTRYRVVAVGESDAHQFGAGETTFTVSKPLLCEAALPRFVRVGDDVSLRAVARQKIAKSAKITVKCITEGLDLKNNQPITLPAPQDIPEVFNFDAHVRDDSSGVKVRFEATSDLGESDFVEMSLPVRPPSVLRKETMSATVKTATFDPQSIAPKSWQGGRGSFDVTLSTSPWLSKLTGLPTILDYPHGCFEQISSRILAYSMMTDLLANLPDLQGREENYNAMVAGGLKLFSQSLLEGGRLPYWPGSQSPDDFVTTQTAWAVREAEKAGVEIPGDLAERLSGALQKIVTGDGVNATVLTRCLALMVSSWLNADPALATSAQDLYLKRDEFTDEGRALLAIAMQRLNIMPKEKAQLMKEIAKPVAERAFDPETFGSTTRAEAIITLAFAEVAPSTPQFKQRHDRLLKLLDSSSNLSTQENLWLLLAFKATHDAATPVALKAGDISPKPPLLAKNHTGAAWTNNDLAALERFKIDGLPGASAPLSALVTAEYRTAKPETDRSDRGLRIERVARDLTDPKRTGDADAPFKLGDQILVTYRVLSRNVQDYVALEDLLPAGLETVNPNLPLVAKNYKIPTDPGSHELDLSHSDLRDDETCLYFDHLDSGNGVYSVLARATTAGSFHWPATKIAPMYDSRFTGLSASADCIVRE